MKNASAILCGAAFVFFSGSVLFVVHQRFFRPVFQCDHSVADLGTLLRGEEARCSFRIVNGGRGILVIRDVTPTCGSCLRVSRFTQHPIGPGNVGEIQLTLRTTALRGSVLKTVMVTSNDPTHPRAILQMRAFVSERESIATQSDEMPRSKSGRPDPHW